MTLSVCLEEGAFKQLGRNDATSGGLCLSLSLSLSLPPSLSPSPNQPCHSTWQLLLLSNGDVTVWYNEAIPLITTTLSGPT